MLKIEVRYRPIGWLPFSRRVECDVPQNWCEVTQNQLIAIARLYKSGISDFAFLKTMSGLKGKIINRLSDFERFKLTEIFDFVGDQKPYHEFIIHQIVLPSQRLRNGEILFAPEGKLKGVTFGQFIFADSYFANYQQSSDQNDLNKFIASLYLKKDELFDEKHIQNRHAKIGKIDKNTREAIALNYQLIHEWLALAYPLIFQKRQESIDDDKTRNQQPATNDPNSWIKVFQNFVGDDIIHDEVWAAKPVNTIFSYMTRKYKENARKK